MIWARSCCPACRGLCSRAQRLRNTGGAPESRLRNCRSRSPLLAAARRQQKHDRASNFHEGPWAGMDGVPAEADLIAGRKDALQIGAGVYAPRIRDPTSALIASTITY